MLISFRLLCCCVSVLSLFLPITGACICTLHALEIRDEYIYSIIKSILTHLNQTILLFLAGELANNNNNNNKTHTRKTTNENAD